MPTSTPRFQHLHRRWFSEFMSATRSCLVISGGVLCVASAYGAPSTPSLPTQRTLKALTVEQLMDIDVTSVSKRPERLFETASAIQLVTSDDIRRSGAMSLPEALRLATNLEVAQIDSRQWAI